MTNNEGDEQEPARFKRLGTWARSSVPVIALAAIALALIPFPEATCQQVCEATLFRKFTVTGFTCLVLGSTLLMYWGARDARQDIPAFVRSILAWVLKLHPRILGFLAKVMLIMLETIKAKAIALAKDKARTEGHAEGRTEGHAEAKTEFRSWLNRQREAGTLSYDESDPPPD